MLSGGLFTSMRNEEGGVRNHVPRAYCATKKRSEESISSLLTPRSSWLLGRFRRRHLDNCGDYMVQRCDEKRTLAVELGALTFGDRVPALLVERHARIAVHTVDEHLEVEVRRGRETGRADVGDGLRDGHARAAPNALREAAEVAVTRDEAVAMANLQHVAVSAFATGEEHDPIPDRAHGRARRRGVVDALVATHRAENRVTTHAEAARDSAECHRRAEKRGAQRTTRLVEVVAADTRARITNRLHRLAREHEARGENLAHSHRSTGADGPLEEHAELIPLAKLAAHVHAILVD